MVSYLSEWLQKLILLILLASIVDLILPNSTIQKYARMTIGLLIILALLSPVLTLLKFDQIERIISLNSFSLQKSPTKLESKKDYLEEAEKLRVQQNQSILNQFASNLKYEIISDIQNRYKTQADVEVFLSLNKENEPKIDKILVYLLGRVHMKDNKGNQIDHSDNLSRKIESIPTVEIEITAQNLEKPVSTIDSVEDQELIEPVQSYLLEAYHLSDEQLEIRSQKRRN